MIQIKMVFETKKIILIGMLILIIIFIFGCTESAIPFGAKNCDENINCFLEATASCNHVVGKINNGVEGQGSNLSVSYELKQISDTNCMFRVSIDKLYFDAEEYVGKLPANQTINALSILGETNPSKLNVSVSDPAYDPKNAKDQENLLRFYISYINRKAETSLPILSYCYAEMKDGSVIAASKCDQDFKSVLSGWGAELGPLLESQRTELESKNVGLGEIGLTNYKSALNQYDLASIGLVRTEVFLPNSANLKNFEIDFDSFDVTHDIENLGSDFGFSFTATLLSNEEEARNFYVDAKNNFIQNISSMKIKEGVFGENSYLSKIAVENGLSTYRLFYTKENKLVLVDVFSEDMNDILVLEKLEEVVTNYNKKFLGSEESFNLECTFKSETKEVCVTSQKQEDYTEEVCNRRAYQFQQGQAQGTKSDGLFGYGCYTKVESQVINLEDTQGIFNFEVTFFDSISQELLTKSESFTLNPGVSTTLSIQYDYSCSQDPLPEKYTSKVVPPTKEFCSDVVKQRTVPVETCSDKVVYTPECN